MQSPTGETPDIPNTPDEYYDPKAHIPLRDDNPELHPFFCAAFLIITIAIMAATAEWLVHSLNFVKERGGIREEYVFPFFLFKIHPN